VPFKIVEGLLKGMQTYEFHLRKWTRLKKNRLKKCLAKPHGDRPQIFFYVNLLQGNAVLPQNIGAKEEYQCSLTLKFINVRLKLAVFCSSEFEVFFSLIISGFHQMHLV